MRPFPSCAAGACCVLLVAGLVTGRAGTSRDDETPSIKKIMDELHKGAKSPLSTMKTGAQGRVTRRGRDQEAGQALRRIGGFTPKERSAQRRQGGI